MNPVTVAAVVIAVTICAVAAYVLWTWQDRKRQAEKADLRWLLNRAAARRDEAEAQLREMAGEDEWEQREFWVIAAELGSDEGGSQ